MFCVGCKIVKSVMTLLLFVDITFYRCYRKVDFGVYRDRKGVIRLYYASPAESFIFRLPSLKLSKPPLAAQKGGL
jgi:hypothetical protein